MFLVIIIPIFIGVAVAFISLMPKGDKWAKEQYYKSLEEIKKLCER